MQRARVEAGGYSVADRSVSHGLEGRRQPEHPERYWTRGLRWSKTQYLLVHLPWPSKEGGEYERENI